MIRYFCDWCGKEVEATGAKSGALRLVPFMSEGHSGEEVCDDCEKEFTAAYRAARANRIRVHA